MTDLSRGSDDVSDGTSQDESNAESGSESSGDRAEPAFDDGDLDVEGLPDPADDYDDGELDYDALPEYEAEYDDGELDDDSLPDRTDPSSVSGDTDEPTSDGEDTGDDSASLSADDDDRTAAVHDARAEVARAGDTAEARENVADVYAEADAEGLGPFTPEAFEAGAEEASDRAAAQSPPAKEVEFVPPEPNKEVELQAPSSTEVGAASGDSIGAGDPRTSEKAAGAVGPDGDARSGDFVPKEGEYQYLAANDSMGVELSKQPEIASELRENIESARRGVEQWGDVDRGHADTWFGNSTEETRERLQRVFTNIEAEIDNVKLLPMEPGKGGPDCYAYVYPNDTARNVYVGERFWRADENPPDSQSGILVHEMSHFADIAGTGDFAYGHSGSKDLAVVDSDSALANADNIEYFFEEYRKGY